MSKGKKRNFNKPVLPVKRHGIKMPPPKLVKPVDVYESDFGAWDKGAIQKILDDMPKGVPEFEWVTPDKPFGGGGGYIELGTTPNGYNEFYEAGRRRALGIDKQPEEKDWAEEWYEKNR